MGTFKEELRYAFDEGSWISFIFATFKPSPVTGA